MTTVPLSEEQLWLIHREYAIEFYTWAPTLLDVDRLRFGTGIALWIPFAVHPRQMCCASGLR